MSFRRFRLLPRGRDRTSAPWTTNDANGSTWNDANGSTWNDVNGSTRNDVNGSTWYDANGSTRNDANGSTRNDATYGLTWSVSRPRTTGYASCDARAATYDEHESAYRPSKLPNVRLVILTQFI
jgi:hypothetical protein